ncbi:MAG: YkgJ family cysteine cluster protein [Vicinamibacteria bacterium]
MKRVALSVYDLRLAIHRNRARANGDIRYELGGACILCARCCEAPGIQVGFVTWHFPLIRRVFLQWHRRVNGFELVEKNRRDRAFIFRCAHFDPETRRCDSYHSRPGMCRDYPRAHLEQANPELFEGCGFRAVAHGREVLLQILEEKSLTVDQKAKLKTELYLED